MKRLKVDEWVGIASAVLGLLGLWVSSWPE